MHEVEVEEVEEMYDHFYIETISLNPPNVDAHVNNIKSCEQQKEKRVPLSVEGKKISFKLDTGSEVNILPFHMYESHCSKTKLVPTKAKLVGYFGNSSKPHGKILLHVEHKRKFYPVEFMVVDSKNPIIGLSTCEDLNLVRFVDEIKQSDVRSSNEILKDPKYKSVFKGLGCIKTVVYDMKMKPETKPIVNPPRKVPHPMLNRLKDALDSLCKQGIIEPVTEPT